jgi:EmrB/QacA subfamily drug resistance transporter
VSTAPRQTYDIPDPRRWRALAVCLVAGFMTLLDVSIVNVALPSIQADLGASASDLQWVLAGYALAFGLVLVPAGRLGDARGRRTVFVAGLVLFTCASGACGLAPSPDWLTAARLTQGMGAGLIIPQSAGLIQALFRGAERGRAFGLLGASIGLSTAVGPLLGGTIIAAAGSAEAWRWVFLVNVPVGLAALPLAWRLIPAELGSGRRESLDPVGVLLLALGLFLLLLPLVQAEAAVAGGPLLLAPVGSLLALTAFAVWERRHRGLGRAPVVDFVLFRHRSYALGTALGLLYFAGFTSIFFVLTLFLQNGLGYSALQAGATSTPLAFGGALAALIGGRHVVRIGRPLVVAGLVLSAVGLVAADLLAERLEAASASWVLLAPLLVAGVGSGLVISPNQTLTLAQVPVGVAGSAAGVLQTAQRIGSALGIAVVGAVFFAALGADLGVPSDAGGGLSGGALGGAGGADERWGQALSSGLRVSIAFVLASLALAVADQAGARRTRRRSSPDRGSTPPPDQG